MLMWGVFGTSSLLQCSNAIIGSIYLTVTPIPYARGVPFSGLYPQSRQRASGVVPTEGKMLQLGRLSFFPSPSAIPSLR